MYTKILLAVIIVVLSAFFYLHTKNPNDVTFVMTAKHTYTLPVTLLVFGGFFAGAVLAVANSLLVDARRAIKDMRAKREGRLLAEAEENYRKGVDMLLKGETEGARKLIDKAMKARPGDKRMIISLADTYVRESRPREALKILENGSLANPDSIGILIAIARCASESGDAPRAVKAFEDVIRLDPKNLFALKRLRDFRISDKNWEEASRLQKSVVEAEHEGGARAKERRLLTGLLYEAASRSFLDGNMSAAVVKVKEVLKSDEAFLPAHILLGDILYHQGSASNAVKVWERALEKQPNSEPILLRLEELHIKESAPAKILEKYKLGVIQQPGNINLRLLLARLYLRLEMVDNAIEELERLHQEGEDGFYLQVLLGDAYQRRSQSSRAAELFQKALGLDREYMPPFACSECAHSVESWAPRCPSCSEWNTIVMRRARAAKSPAPTTPRLTLAVSTARR